MAVLDLGLGLGLPRNKKSSKGVIRIPGASIQADFARNFIVGAPSIDMAFPTTRATNGRADDLALDWADFNPNTLRRRDGRGIRCEEVRTNSIRNNSMQGVVAGTPGTQPNFWNMQGSGNGITRTIVGYHVEKGIEYVEVRYAGTATAAINLLIAFEQATQIAATVGQTWTSSFFCRLVGGSIPAGGFFNVPTGRDSSGNFVENAGPSGVAFVPDGTMRRFSGSVTLANANSVFVRSGIQTSLFLGQVIDFTLRIGWPQLELGAGATSPIRTTNVAVQRNGDFTTLLNPNTHTGLTVGWIYIEWEDLLSPSGVFRRLWRYRKDGNNAIEMNLGADGRVSLGSTVGGVAQISNLLSANTTVAGGIYKAAFRFAANNYNAKFSSNLGTQPVIGTNGTLPDLTGATLGIGNVGTDGGQANCNIRAFACGSGLKTDAELLAMVA